METLYPQKLLNYEVPAEWYFRGVRYSGVVRPQGAGSRYYSSWSYIFFPMTQNNIVDSSFVLNAQATDKTKLRAVLMTFLCQSYGVWAPASEPVAVWLNGERKGVYSKSERIDEYYFQRHGLPVYELIKVTCSAAFTLKKADALDAFDWQIPDEASRTMFAEFLHALDTVSGSTMLWQTLGTRYFDIPQYLKFHALQVVVNNVDGLNNNFYFYRATPASKYTVITHDFDNAFSSAREVSLDAENEIISALLRNDSCRVLYYGYMRELIEKYCTEENLFPLIDAYSTLIREENSHLPSWEEATYTAEVERLKNIIIRRRSILRSTLAARSFQ